MSDDPLWSIEQTAEFLRVSTKTLRDWMKESYGPPVYQPGRAYKYVPDEVKAWLRETSVGVRRQTINEVIARRAQ